MKPNTYSTVKLSYHNKVKASERFKITRSNDVHDFAMSFWDMDTFELQESFYVLLLNRANQVLGIHLVGIGTTTGCLIDVRIVMQSAILANAVGIVLLHNHPSGNKQPSANDVDITNKIKEGAKLFDITVLDHLILTTDGYYSFAEEGAL